ncbi:MAG: hypothetical protein J6V02_06870 [Bacteroidaceae bacterium]|nr:hypothetical protein [Bacteroidaceae bacterium]
MMRKIFFVALVVAVLTTIPASIKAGENEWFFETETTITTNYIWRGMSVAGPSVQPDLMFGYGNDDFEVSMDVWANASLDPLYDIDLERTSCNEFDIALSAAYKGFTLTLSDYNYSMFNYFNSSYLDNHELDIQLDYYISDDFPMTISWSSLLHSNGLGDSEFAHYFQFGYEFALLGLDFWCELGAVPTESWYYDVDGFALTNVTLGANLNNAGLQLTYNPAWNDFSFAVSYTF